MTYVFHIDTDPTQMDLFVENHPMNTLFQCSSWVEMYEKCDHLLTSVTENDKIVASAIVLIHRLPFGKSIFYIPRGTVMDYQNIELVTYYMNELKKIAYDRHAIVLRFDPAIVSCMYPYADRKGKHPKQNEEVIAALKNIGAKYKGYTIKKDESTLPRFQAEMEVTKDYRKKLEQKTLKNIKNAEYKGIEVYVGKEYSHDLATMIHATEVRKQITLCNEKKLNHILDVYGKNAICMVSKLNFPQQIEKYKASIQRKESLLQGKLLNKKEAAKLQQQLSKDKNEYDHLIQDYEREKKDEVITAGILALYNKNRMKLLYLGNHPEYLRTHSSYFLYAKCFDYCVQFGISHCSLGGIEGTMDDGSSLFQSNWSMNVEEYIGEFNLVLHKRIYRIYNSLESKHSMLTAKLHW